ncbi:TonB-dependent receptor plug domain-containing protein [Pedobacter borealis]|uniref:TonB-dependent receptor plug domain-containing protein n=1 Tax=Pedobacter borealis TaxID=475254 RepID=UPI0009F9F54A|nr:TonB-dependent receptor plug domain-containing protein [Pedobacter borealis]
MKNIVAFTIIMGFSLVGFAQKADSTKATKITLRDLHATDALEPLIVIDGNKQYTRGSSALNEVNPDNIESISIYKDNVALSKYGTDGLAGVIEIKTKSNAVGSYGLKNKAIKPIDLTLNGKVSGFSIRPLPDCEMPVRKRYLLNRDFDPRAKPLYVVDGKEVSEIKNLDQQSIESIEVLKDSSAITLHGDKGKNGVVIITTKKSKVTPKKN